MDLVSGLRAVRSALLHAAADRLRAVRPHAFVRGAGESPQQPCHGDLFRGRQGHRHLLRAEPFLRSVRRSFPGRFDAPYPARRTRGAADRRGADRHRGRPFQNPFGHRHPLAGPCGSEDRAVAEHLAGRRLDHHAAAGQEPLSARHGAQPRAAGPQRQARHVEAQGVDHGPQARIQLYQGGDRRHVPQYGGVRLQRLRHQVRGPYLLQQGASRAERAGGRRAGGRGECPVALFAGAELRQRPRAPQPRHFAHGGRRGHYAQAARFAQRASHRPQLPSRVAQRRYGDLLPRDAAFS